MEIDSEYNILECSICLTIQFLFFKWNCCKQFMCCNCLSKLYKKSCPYCRAEYNELDWLKGNKYIGHINIKESIDYVIKNWSLNIKHLLELNINNSIVNSIGNETGIIAIKNLKYQFIYYLIVNGFKKNIDISQFSKYFDLFQSLGKSYFEKIYISTILSDKSNIFLPYYETLFSLNNMELKVWLKFSSNLKYKILNDIGILNDSNNKIYKINQLLNLDLGKIKYYDLHPSKTIITLKDGKILSLFQYILLEPELYPIIQSRYLSEEIGCIIINYLVSNIVVGNLYYKSKNSNNGIKLKKILQNDKPFLNNYKDLFIKHLCLINIPSEFMISQTILNIVKNCDKISKKELKQLLFNNLKTISGISEKEYINYLNSALNRYKSFLND